MFGCSCVIFENQSSAINTIQLPTHWFIHRFIKTKIHIVCLANTSSEYRLWVDVSCMQKLFWNNPPYEPTKERPPLPRALVWLYCRSLCVLSIHSSIHYSGSSVSAEPQWRQGAPYSGQLAARTIPWLFLIYPSHSPCCGLESQGDVCLSKRSQS